MAGGRKSAAEEWNTRNLCQKAIETKYGSLEEGIVALLKSDEPILLRWVYEHALGKPKDTVHVDDIKVIVKYADRDNAT